MSTWDNLTIIAIGDHWDHLENLRKIGQIGPLGQLLDKFGNYGVTSEI